MKRRTRPGAASEAMDYFPSPARGRAASLPTTCIAPSAGRVPSRGGSKRTGRYASVWQSKRDPEKCSTNWSRPCRNPNGRRTSASFRCAMAAGSGQAKTKVVSRAEAYLSVSVVHRAGLAAALESPRVPVEVLPEPAGGLRRSHVYEGVALVGKAPGQMQRMRSRIALLGEKTHYH